MHRAFAACTAIFVLLLAADRTAAHEGHEHEPAPPPARIASRGEAQSDALELVAVAEGQALAIYLDRFASNEPIGQADIEVETPTGPVAAHVETGDVFRIVAPWLAKPGKYDLIFTVTVDGDVDVLPVTLDVPDPAPIGGNGATGERGLQVVLVIAASAAGFVFALALMAAVRRRPRAASASIMLAALLLLTTGALAHEGEDQGPVSPQPVGRDLSQRLPDGSVFVPKSDAAHPRDPHRDQRRRPLPAHR